MSIKNLDILFNPQRIAVIGASDDDQSVGYHIFRNLIGKGFKGIVYPVNSSLSGVQGIEAYSTVNDIPYPIDLAWGQLSRKICKQSSKVVAKKG